MSTERAGAVDVLVVGAGPAGLSAGVVAAERGKRVLVLDQGLRPGGQIWRHRNDASIPPPARTLIARARTAGVVIASGARVIDAVAPDELVVDFNGRVDRQRAGSVILATGAKERFLPFPGWTLPGVVGIGGLQALIKTGLRLEGARVVIAGTGPLLLPVAAAAVDAGADVLFVAEQASRARMAEFAATLVRKPRAVIDAVRYRLRFRRAAYCVDSWITGAIGHDRVTQVSISVRGQARVLSCDWLATGAGLCPNTELAELLGCAVSSDGVTVDAQQSTSVDGVFAAGECTGVKGDAAAMIEGAIAGHAAAGAAAVPRALQRRARAGRRFGEALARAFAPRAELLRLADADTIICRCEEVRLRDCDPAWTQRQAKLWTRIGMGECQGGVCGPLCATLFGWSPNRARAPLGTPLCGPWGAAIGDQSGAAIPSSASDASR